MSVPLPDRATLMTAATRALLDDGTIPVGDPDAVGVARLVCDRGGVVAGCPLAKEVFGRSGVRYRAHVAEGSVVAPGDLVADLGGPIAAIGAAAPTAIRLLERMSSVASGVVDPAPGDALEAYAASLRLSTQDAVGDDGPSFRLEP